MIAYCQQNWYVGLAIYTDPFTLNIGIESGEDIVVNVHRSNGCKPKFEEFWQVKVILRYFKNYLQM